MLHASMSNTKEEKLTFPRVEALRRLFTSGFSAADIAEPLVCFDVGASATDVAAFMRQNNFRVVGLRRNGLTDGFCQLPDQPKGNCTDYLREFDESRIFDDSAPLAEVIVALDQQTHVFVRTLGQVGGIITRTDLQKAPVRMWLFGMVTLIEMRITHMIRGVYANDRWRDYLSEKRLEKAQALLQERCRRNQDLTLLDCLQFSDKGQIVARSEKLRAMTRFESRREIQRDVKLLEALRNSLAHAQDIITSDWDAIILLTKDIDRILTGPG